MKCPTRIEQDLFDYLSPDKQAEIEEHYGEFARDSKELKKRPYVPIFDPDTEFDLQRDLRIDREKREAIRRAAEEAGDAIRGLSKDDTEAAIGEMIDLSDERTRLMIEGEEIERCDLCGRLKNS